MVLCGLEKLWGDGKKWCSEEGGLLAAAEPEILALGRGGGALEGAAVASCQPVEGLPG